MRAVLLFFAVLLPFISGAEPALRVIYGSPMRQLDSVDQRYQLQLLREALQASGEPFTLQPSGQDMVQSRVLKEIAAGQVDVYWSMTSAAREQQLLPVRISLDKGLNGWRLLLIRQGEQARFQHIQVLSQLKKLTFIQGHDWPDTAILQHNGLSVLTSAHPPQLFDMLQKQRGDAFPRAVFEAYGDALRQPAQFAVESQLVLVYPSAVYFFVNRDNQRLASAIERGLRQLIASGRFELLFQQRYGAAIALAGLAKRRQIRLENPLAPLNFPLADSPLWFQPSVAQPSAAQPSVAQPNLAGHQSIPGLSGRSAIGVTGMNGPCFGFNLLKRH